MPDFSNYSKLKEDARPREYTFEEIKGQPSVMSRPATSANERYHSKAIKLINRKVGRRARTNTATVIAGRKTDAKLLADYCVTGWGTPPVDASTRQPVEFSPKNCEEFFLAIPDYMFDSFRAWVSEPTNFVDYEDEDDGEDLSPGESRNSSESESLGSAATAETDTQ